MTLFARLALRVSGAAPLLQPRTAVRFAPAVPLHGGPSFAASPAPSVSAAAPVPAQPAGPEGRAPVTAPASVAARGPVAPSRRAFVPDAAPMRGPGATPSRHDVPAAPLVDRAVHPLSAMPAATAPAADGEPRGVVAVSRDPVAPVPLPMAPAPTPAAPFRPAIAASEDGAASPNSDLPARAPLATPPSAPPSAPGRGRLDRIAPPHAELATVVEVRIGAIEVHTPPPPAPVARGESRLMSLDAYLARGRRR